MAIKLYKQRPKTAKEIILEQILNLLEEGKLGKGSELPTEREIAEQVGVSRVAVREAISALTAMGIVTTVHGSGTRIVENTDDILKNALKVICLLESHDPDTLTDLYPIIKDLITDKFRLTKGEN